MSSPALGPLAADLPTVLVHPPRIFSLMPFWFWNDDLDEAEIRRQIADFAAHGVYGFVIHPRVGLPRHLGWMSDRLLRFYDLAVAQARQRGMYVVLYDEGMYPSGSAHGQVVAENPAYEMRALARIELSGQTPPALGEGHHLLTVLRRTTGENVAIIDRPAHSRIRGLHYVEPGDPPSPDHGPPRDTDPAQDEPLAGDLLNPAAVDCFIRLVYQRFAQRYRADLGRTILGIFTDEPNVLGKFHERDLRPGTTGILEHVQRLLGYDFTPQLLSLWYDDEPDAAKHRAAYRWAIQRRLAETFYARLSAFCLEHGLPLTGHPSASDDIGALRYFQIPGQDLVWRWVLPGKTATAGGDATMAKCSSSAMIHLGRQRNSNEYCGAYGHQFTFEEMHWLSNWCFVRGVNLLYPHAFYYSYRGPRRDERPPDVGPNSPWWGRYRDYADGCRRLSWLNSDGRHVCQVAILGLPEHLPWQAAEILQKNQVDFNYLEARHLGEDAKVDGSGIRIGPMHYPALIVDDLPALPSEAWPALAALAAAGRLLLVGGPAQAAQLPGAIVVADGGQLLSHLEQLAPRDLLCTPATEAIRFRHVEKEGSQWYLIFNESTAPVATAIRVAAAGVQTWIDPDGETPQVLAAPPAVWPPFQLLVLRVSPPR